MIDFSKECNFLKPSVDIDYNNIFAVDFNLLLNSLAKRYNLHIKQIELYNGFSSAIYSILKFLDLEHCVVYSPCTLEYKKAALNLKYDVRLINRFENLFLPIREKSVVVFANPSYLDGTYYDLDKLLEYWISKEATIIIDETLLDFCSENATINYLNIYDKIYIIKDFSKYYSNEYLSLSSIFSSENNISNLRIFEPDNKLSNFHMKYLKECLKDNKFRLISNSINTKNKVELEKFFYSCKYVDYLFSSSSNSLLIKLKNISSKKFLEKLEEKDIKLPNCLKYDFLDDSFVNIYVSSGENIRNLKEAIYAI